MLKMKSLGLHSIRRGFTLIEIMVVLGIIALLASMLGVTIANMAESAREAQTTATITKIDGLITERQRGLERLFRGNDFERYVNNVERALRQNNTPLSAMSPRAFEIIAKKQAVREFFPQRFAEMDDFNNDGIPDRIASDDVYGVGVVPPAVTWVTTAGVQQYPQNRTTSAAHDPLTESSEILYFMLTRMEVLGFPPVGEGEFLTQEVSDTDNDGLPEFVDGWGQPLRFYRWPTRLIRPFGVLGLDQVPGSPGDDDGIGGTDDTLEIGFPGTDDVIIDPDVRFLASTYIAGLPGPPGVTGQYDFLNEDPDDAYGLLLAETKRLFALSGGSTDVIRSFNETNFHSVDTYSVPLIVSAGSDGILGLFEPNVISEGDYDGSGSLESYEDANRNGTRDLPTADINGDGTLEAVQGHLAMPRGVLDLPSFGAADDISNLNGRAGG